MQICYLGIGSNLGNRRKNISLAIRKLRLSEGIKVIKTSPLIETSPVGGPPAQGNFLNGAIKIKTGLSPQALLNKLQNIEKELGRLKIARFGPRVIDLDILLYGDKIVNTKRLTIPHPRMFERDFVLKPLAQVI